MVRRYFKGEKYIRENQNLLVLDLNLGISVSLLVEVLYRVKFFLEYFFLIVLGFKIGKKLKFLYVYGQNVCKFCGMWGSDKLLILWIL